MAFPSLSTRFESSPPCRKWTKSTLPCASQSPKHSRARLRQEHFAKPIHIVEGGEHRQQSVGNALAALKAAKEDIILVHDAVRPFVDAEIIGNVIEGAEKRGAAIAAIPAFDTIKQVDRTSEGAVVNATIPREHIVLVQTPQGFRYHVLKKAFDEAERDGFVGTDEASIVERSGHEVSVVMGSRRNIKITTPDDLDLAEFFAKKANSHQQLAFSQVSRI